MSTPILNKMAMLLSEGITEETVGNVSIEEVMAHLEQAKAAQEDDDKISAVDHLNDAQDTLSVLIRQF